MKITEFKIFTEKARLVISSSSVKLDDANIHGNMFVSREEEKPSFVLINITAKVTDKDSLVELKGLINQTDF